MEPSQGHDPPDIGDATGGGPRRRPGGGRRRTAAIGLVLAMLGAGMAVAARSATRPDEPARPATGGADRADEVDMPVAGMVVVLRRPGLTDVPVQAGLESPVYVTVDGTAPVAAVELWAGAELVERVVPDDERLGRTETLTYVPDEPGMATVVARAVDAEGRWGQSNPLRLEVIEPVPLAAIRPLVTLDGDTLASVADRAGVEVDLIAALNPGLSEAGAGPLPAGTEVGAPIALDDLPPPPDADPAGGEPAEPAEVDGQAAGSASVAELIEPIPGGLDLVAAPDLALAIDDCTVTATSTAVDPLGGLTLVQVPPTGESFYPVFDFGPADAGESASTEVPVSAGLQTFAVAGANDGTVETWSGVEELLVPEECDGWTGAAKLVNGQLVTGTGDVPDADAAYLYLSTEVDEWIRVPAAGFVTRGAYGFDFTPHLPPLQGHDLALEAWGRKDGALVELGTGALSLDPSTSIDTVVPVPKVQLHWIANDGETYKSGAPKPEELVTEGTANLPHFLKFRWSTAMPGITHMVWQVTSTPVPPAAGPLGGNVLLQGMVPAGQDTFSIDFSKLFFDLSNPQPATAPDYLGDDGGGGTSAASLDGAQAYDLMQGSTDQALGATSSSGPVLIPGLTIVGAYGQFVVRAVPFAGDSYVGAVSNDVTIQTTEEPVFPEAPQGTSDHELDLELVEEPRPPNPVMSACWQIAGYADEATYNAKLAQAKSANASSGSLGAWASNQYTFWDVMWNQLGSNPICAGCYQFGSTKVALAGSTCSSSSVWGDLFSAFKAFVDMLANGFAFLKDLVVEAVATLSLCKAVSNAAEGGATGESICNTLAEVVVNSALISLGIPPTVPNFDQLMAAAKGEVVELGAALAAQAGVPCDDAEFAAEIHGEQEVTCEGAVEALLDEVATQLNQAYVDTATSMGFNFPSELKVIPHPDGQVKPATVRLEVSPTIYTAAVEGQACTALVATSSVWVAKPDAAGTFAYGKPPAPAAVVSGLFPGWGYGPTHHEVPKAVWSNPTFDAGFVELPDLPSTGPSGTYGAASRTYQLYPPASLEPVDVAGLSKSSGINQPAQTHKSWITIPRQVLLLNKDAILKVTAVSSCAGSLTRFYRLHGFTEPSAPPVEIPG